MRIRISSVVFLLFVIGALNADDVNMLSQGHQEFLEQIQNFKGLRQVRPNQVTEQFVPKSVDYLFDGIPTTRMEFQHPSVGIWNGISQEWNISPAALSASIQFVHRDFQNASFSMSLFKKGSYPKATMPEDWMGVAAGFLDKFGSEIKFDNWQDGNFVDPSMPFAFNTFDPKSFGFSHADTAGNLTIHRIYFLFLQKWTLVIEYRSPESYFEATFPAFDRYVNRMVISEQ